MPSTELQTYGEYILRTGKGLAGELERVYGAFWFRSRFAGKRPILDLGPGRCWFSKQDPSAVIAVDNSPELIEHFRAEGIDIRLGDAYDLPFAENYFEGVFCCWLLEHLAEPFRALIEIQRVLQPGGNACVIVPSPHDMAAFYDDYTHVRPFTSNSLRQLAEDAGFASYRIACLPCDFGLSWVLRFFGPIRAVGYLESADAVLRRLFLLNRNHLVLDCWK